MGNDNVFELRFKDGVIKIHWRWIKKFSYDKSKKNVREELVPQILSFEILDVEDYEFPDWKKLYKILVKYGIDKSRKTIKIKNKSVWDFLY